MKKILTILLLGFFLISLASALDIDNWKFEQDKTFDGKLVSENNLLQKYKPIEIKNWLGLGETLFEGYLSQHTEICGIDCKSTIEINLHEDGVLVDEIIFKTLQEDGSWINQDVRNYQFKYLGNIDDYKLKCIDGKYSEVNKSYEQICSNEKVGSHEGWINYDLGEEVSKGIYTLKLDAQKKPSRTVDWIIKTNGEWLESWATWGNISLGDDAEVILNSPVNNYIALIPDVVLNCSANITGGAFLTNISLWTNESGSWEGYNYTEFSSNETIETLAHGTSMDAYGGTPGSTGMAINVTSGGRTLIGFNKVSGSGVTTGRIGTTVLGGDIATCSFVGNTCNFSSPVELSNNTNYYITGNIGGSFYWKGSPPTVRSNSAFTWIGRIDQAENIGANSVATVESLIIGYDYSTHTTKTFNSTHTTKTFNRTITDTLLWSCQACDSDGDCGFATSNFTVFLDAELPQIEIETPNGTLDYNAIGQLETLNATFTDTNLDSCWYNYNGTNISIDGCLTGVKNSTTFILEEGNLNMTIYANDSIGNKNSTFIEWNYSYLEHNRTHNNQSYETAEESFNINVEGPTSAS